MKMKKILSVILLFAMLALSLSSCGAPDYCEYAQTRDTEGRDIHYVEIKVKDYGKITVLLDATTAPITVANFLGLVESGFYNGLKLHRVIIDFMIQGGDPNGDGTGGAEKEIIGEFSKNGFDNDISHKRGVISMARSQSYNSASSQFFICNADSTGLDGEYAAFGYVVQGMRVVDKITKDVFPKTYLADYYKNLNYHPYYNATYHDLWAYYGNGALENDADKPVIEYIKVIENYEG